MYQTMMSTTTVGSEKPTQDCTYMLRLHFMRRNQHVFSLFDGLNGPEISIYCRRHLDHQIQQSFLYGDSRMHISLKQAFLCFEDQLQEPKTKEELRKIRREFFSHSESDSTMSHGCEVALGVLKGKQLHMAFLGDFRCLVIRKSQFLAIYPNARCPSEPPKTTRSSHLLGAPTNKKDPSPTSAYPFEPDVFSYVITPEDAALILFNRSIAKALDDESIAKFVRDRLDTRTVKEINIELLRQITLADKKGDKSGKSKENLANLIVKIKNYEGFEEG